MKTFGNIASFNSEQCTGAIKPEAGGAFLSFDKTAFSWDIEAAPPKTGQRLSYEVGTDSDHNRCAVNLQTI